MQRTPQSSSGPQSNRTCPSRFVDHMQELFGEEPDPQFLEESWTVGVPAAIENLHRRRRQRSGLLSAPETSGEDLAIRELERMAALGGGIHSFLEERSQPVERRYAPAWIERAPLDWSDQKREPVSSASRTRQPEFLMSTENASGLLGVSSAASRDQVRSAYRRKVSQCHPDHHQNASDVTRRRATEQLAELNEAYRLLCEQLLDQAA